MHLRLALAVPLREVKRSAEDAWARDEANGTHYFDSGACNALDWITEYYSDYV
jgi:hypothetical protein